MFKLYRRFMRFNRIASTRIELEKQKQNIENAFWHSALSFSHWSPSNAMKDTIADDQSDYWKSPEN